MNYLTKFLQEQGSDLPQPPIDNVEAIALRIAKEAPTLSQLSPEQLQQIAQIVMTQNLVSDLKIESDIKGIDYKKEKEMFLKTAGRTGSVNTREVYSRAIRRLEDYCEKNSLKLLALSYSAADDYIYSLKNELANKSVLIYIRAVSSFYTFLERRFASVKNPFRNSRATPPDTVAKQTVVPTADEVSVILEQANLLDKSVISLLAYSGFRIGALPKMTIRNGGNFHSFSKGKPLNGFLPKKSGLSRLSCGGAMKNDKI